MRLLDLREEFTGDRTRSARNEDSMPGLQNRLTAADIWGYGQHGWPNGTHRRQMEIAGEEYQELSDELNRAASTSISPRC